MAASKLSDLLPIPQGVGEPNALQVFGLGGGEDSAAIKSAVKQVYANLKAAKSQTDPKLWQQAAKLAKDAKAALADPNTLAQLKSQLNAPSGLPPTGVPPTGAPPTGAPPAGAATTVDPLSGMLPSADPLAGMLPPANPMQANPMQANPMGAQVPMGAQAPMAPSPPMPSHPQAMQQGYPQHPVQLNPAQQIPAQQQPQPTAVPPGYQQTGYQQTGYPQQTIAYPPQAVPNANSVNGHLANHGQPMQPSAAPAPVAPAGPVFKTKKSKKRRKKSGIGLFVISACVLGLVIVGLAVFKAFGPGVSITKDGDMAITKPAASTAPVQKTTTQPRKQRPRKKKPTDPVMGDMAGDVPPPKSYTETGLPVNKFSPPQTTRDMRKKDRQDQSMDGPMSLESPDIPGVSDVVKPGVVQAAPIDPDAMLPISPPSETPSSQMNKADVKKADAKIADVKQLIRDAKWVEMKPSAEQLTEMMLTPEQRVQADALYNLADLATYYRGALQRGLGTLQPTQDFDVADGFRVIVVQVSTSSITIMFNKRNKTYSIDELPLRLGEKIASFALSPDKPDSIAAKNVYQSMVQQATEAHRSDAIESLMSLNGQLEEVDTKDVAEMIKALFK